jgi:hypothetical protein
MRVPRSAPALTRSPRSMVQAKSIWRVMMARSGALTGQYRGRITEPTNREAGLEARHRCNADAKIP